MSEWVRPVDGKITIPESGWYEIDSRQGARKVSPDEPFEPRAHGMRLVWPEAAQLPEILSMSAHEDGTVTAALDYGPVVAIVDVDPKPRTEFTDLRLDES